MLEEKILLIDGSSMLTSNFYGTVPKEFYKAKTDEEKENVYKSLMQTSTGIYTNAVYTTLKMLFKIIEKCNITHLAIAFDMSRNTFRREMCEDYKGQRKATPSPLKSQFALMEDILMRLNIPVLLSDKFEADDLIGSLAEKLKSNNNVYLWSKDKDYLQLVDKNVTLWMALADKITEENLYKKSGIKNPGNIPDKTFPYTPELVKKIYGLNPCQIADWKAMSGDPSDNIKGIQGISDKTTIPLLQTYGTMESVYHELKKCKNNPEKEKDLAVKWKKELGINRNPIKYLKEGEVSGQLSKILATIQTDVELEIEKDELILNINKKELSMIIEELEMKSLF